MTTEPADEATPGSKGAKLYFAATIAAQVCALLRYIALARLLDPEQLGFAATLMLTASFFDLITDTGGDRFLIQAKDGDQESVQGLVHLGQIIRGLLVATLLVGLAWPISRLYRAPELVFGLAALALPPLISSVVHLDMRRAQRRLDFRAEGLALIVSEPLSVLVTLAAVLITHSFSAVVYGLLVRSLVAVVISHLRSERPFTVSFDRAHLGEFLRFSGPLMLNGLLLFLGSQSDRVIVGSQLSVRELGLYSAVTLLIYYPASMILRYATAMYLPLVSYVRSDAERRKSADLLGGQSVLVALLMSSGFALTMPIVVPLLYGPKFVQPGLTLALIGVLQSSRFMILWPNTVAIGSGRSGVVLAANIVRLVALPIGVAGARLTGRLDAVVAGFVVGEWVAVGCGLALTRGEIGADMGSSYGRFARFVLACCVIIAWPVALRTGSWPLELVLAVASAAVVRWIVKAERSTLRETIQLFGRAGLRSAFTHSASS